MVSRRSKHDRGSRRKRPRAAARIRRLDWLQADSEPTEERDEDKFYLGYTRTFWALWFLDQKPRQHKLLLEMPKKISRDPIMPGGPRGSRDLPEKQEAVGRLALIELLASKKPMPALVRQALIDNLTEAAEFSPHQLIFAPRSKASISATKDRKIAHFAEEEARTKDWKNVIKDTAKAFGMSERAVWDALARDRKRHPERHRYRQKRR
jgi:hypothetical protein